MKDLSSYLFEADLSGALALLQTGADINVKNARGTRPIIAAINSDQPEVLQFVIIHGANVNIDQGAPLSEAIDYCIDGMIQDQLPEPDPVAMRMLSILLENGANPELRNDRGRRPIDIISAYAHNAESSQRLKSYFRALIPNIDELLK